MSETLYMWRGLNTSSALSAVQNYLMPIVVKLWLINGLVHSNTRGQKVHIIPLSAIHFLTAEPRPACHRSNKLITFHLRLEYFFFFRCV